MSDYDAMMRAVLENPGDDTLRLVFADWLEETQKPAHIARSAFIRSQVRRHNYTGDVSIQKQLEVAAAVREEEKLLKKWGAGWLPRAIRLPGHCIVWKGQIAAFPSLMVPSYATFERGFIERLGFEIPTTNEPTAAATIIAMAYSVQGVFAAAPLVGVSISFGAPGGWDDTTFHLEIFRTESPGGWIMGGGPAQMLPRWWSAKTRREFAQAIKANLDCAIASIARPLLEAAQQHDNGFDPWPTQVEIDEYHRAQEEAMQSAIENMGLPPG